MSGIIKLIILCLFCYGCYWLADVYVLNKNLASNQQQEDTNEVELTDSDQTLIAENQTTKSSRQQTSQVYKWTDENGKVHFGDAKPEDQAVDVAQYTVNQVQTTEFKETPRIAAPPPVATRQNVQPNRVETRSEPSRCEYLKKRIKELKDRRGTRTLHSSHNAREQELSDLRWEKQKKC